MAMRPRQMSHVDPGPAAGAPERWVASTCGMCSIGCGLEIGVSGNTIVGVCGRVDHPVGLGRLGPKGLNQFYANRHPSRALHPMIRNASGHLVRASWDDAMGLVTQRWQEALALEGPDAVAIYHTGQLVLEEYYTLGKIARGMGMNNLDANTRLCTATQAESLMASFGADGPMAAYADFDATECILLVGHNAAEQSTVLWMRIMAAKDGPNRPKVIVVDPRRTLTVRTGADLQLQLRPGTNLPLLNGLAHLLVERGHIDQAFIAQHTVGFDRLRATLARYTPDEVERITGVPAADLRQAAEWIGTSKTTVSTCLQGVYQSHQATESACAVNNIHLLTGKIGKPGSAPFQFAGQPSSMNTRETGADGAYPGFRDWQNVQAMQELAERWNAAPELLGKKPVTAGEIFELAGRGVVKCLWVICTNPAASMTDRPHQLETLQHTFTVVQDGFATTETASFADVLLPAAIWGEKTGCMTNSERRVNLRQKAVDPPGEARADFEIFLDFARRMRLTDRDGRPLIRYTTPEQAFDEWREISRGTIPDYSGMTYAKILERGGIQWPCNAEHPDGAERRYTDAQFPSGYQLKEHYARDLKTGKDGGQREYRERLDPDGVPRLGRAFLVAADYDPPVDAPDAQYPLTAISGRQAYHWHTRTKTAKAPYLAGAAPGAFVGMNAGDAQALGVADGDVVRVTSRRGFVEAPAKVGDVVRAGSVFVPFHYGELGASEAANNLMPRSRDPASKQPQQKFAAVRVERVAAASGMPWWRSGEAG